MRERLLPLPDGGFVKLGLPSGSVCVDCFEAMLMEGEASVDMRLLLDRVVLGCTAVGAALGSGLPCTGVASAADISTSGWWSFRLLVISSESLALSCALGLALPDAGGASALA